MGVMQGTLVVVIKILLKYTRVFNVWRALNNLMLRKTKLSLWIIRQFCIIIHAYVVSDNYGWNLGKSYLVIPYYEIALHRKH